MRGGAGEGGPRNCGSRLRIRSVSSIGTFGPFLKFSERSDSRLTLRDLSISAKSRQLVRCCGALAHRQASSSIKREDEPPLTAVNIEVVFLGDLPNHRAHVRCAVDDG